MVFTNTSSTWWHCRHLTWSLRNTSAYIRLCKTMVLCPCPVWGSNSWSRCRSGPTLTHTTLTVNYKLVVLKHMTPYIVEDMYQRFVWTFCRNLQGRSLIDSSAMKMYCPKTTKFDDAYCVVFAVLLVVLLLFSRCRYFSFHVGVFGLNAIQTSTTALTR
jgi:hypothetical protein